MPNALTGFALRAAHPEAVAVGGPIANDVTATVKWFNRDHGFGFLEGGDGPDIYVHYSDLPGPGLQTLEWGQRVRVDVFDGRYSGNTGPVAKNVRTLE